MLKIIATVGTIQVVAILINLIRTKVVAVLLGPEGVGVVSTIDQVIQSAAYFSALSLPFAAVKFLSRAHSDGPDAFRASYGGFLKVLLLLSIVGTAVILAVVTLGSGLLGQQTSRYRGYAVIASIGIPAMVLGGFFVNVLAAARRTRASALMAVITNGAFTAAAAAGVLIGGISGLYVGTVAAGLLLTAGTVVYFHKALALPVYDRTPGPLRQLRRNPGIVSFTATQFLATMAYSASLLVARYTILEGFGEAEAGLLQAALAIALAVGLVLNPTNGLFLTPMVNRSITNDEKLAAVAEFQKKLMLVLSAAVMPIILFPDVVLSLLFSSRFTAASQFVFLFVVWQCLVQLAGVYQALLIGFDDLKAYAAITGVGHIGSAALCWILVPRYGILGVSIAFVVSNSAILLLSLGRLAVRYHLRVSRGVAMLTCYNLAALVIGGLVFSKFPDTGAAPALLKLAGYALFVASLVCFLSKDERNSLLGLWERSRLRSARAS
jgi:PST family polysaccharide transporter